MTIANAGPKVALVGIPGRNTLRTPKGLRAEESSWRSLAAAVVLQAIDDIRQGASSKDSVTQLKGLDALLWLQSEDCKLMLETLDLETVKPIQALMVYVRGKEVEKWQ